MSLIIRKVLRGSMRRVGCDHGHRNFITVQGIDSRAFPNYSALSWQDSPDTKKTVGVTILVRT